MAKTTQKTLPTAVSVDEFIDAVEPEAKRADARVLKTLMSELTGHEPTMWGPSMVGFGEYAYRYDSGHSGTSFRMGFSPRRAALTIYCIPGYEHVPEIMARLGRHTTGKSCLYVKKLADIDPAVLEELLRHGWAEMARRYP